MLKFSDRFKQYIESNGLVTHDDKILLTVSGGVDSMVSLDIFTKLGYTVGVAHCNFQLRGAESEEDEVLVEEQAQKRGVPCYNKRFDTIGEMERTGDSMEMAARRLRYEWFYELCAEHGYTTIAVAHHIDDSIETFFINLMRGTGLRGLTGINKQFGKVVRPLMFASRKDILEYAVNQKLPFREDSSNRSTKYLRNKIRLGLVPRIREINPKFTDLMRRNISRLTDAQSFIDSCIKQIHAKVISSEEGIDKLHIELIDGDLPRGFVVYELLSSYYGFKGDVIDSLLFAHENQNSGKRFYAKEFVAYIDREDILITPIMSDDICEVLIGESDVRTYCGNSVLHHEHTVIDLIESMTVADNCALLDADKLKYPLTVRKWQEGDWFIPFGMSGKKKISDFLIDQKVSLPEKERQFVLTSGDDIVWVIGRRTDNRYRLESDSENVLKITKEII
ncbi:MAG: tRNA lysidine(34) synthetase TilS [Rikenellaceae bacterium]